jgi:hypothetical protein
MATMAIATAARMAVLAGAALSLTKRVLAEDGGLSRTTDLPDTGAGNEWNAQGE